MRNLVLFLGIAVLLSACSDPGTDTVGSASDGRHEPTVVGQEARSPSLGKRAAPVRIEAEKVDELGAVILGVSLDDVESHEAFAEKYSLPFSILADVEKQTAKDYGVYTKIATFEMARRETFLIDPEGRIAKHYEKVNPATHSQEVLEDLRELSATPAG